MLALSVGRHRALKAGKDLRRLMPPVRRVPELDDAVQGLLLLGLPPRRRSLAGPPCPSRRPLAIARLRRRWAPATAALMLCLHRGTVIMVPGAGGISHFIIIRSPYRLMLPLKPMLLVVLAPVQTMMSLSVDKCLLRIINAHPETVVAPMAMRGELYCSLRQDLLARNPGDVAPSVAVEVFLKMRSWHVPAHRGYTRRSRQWRRPVMTFCVCRRPNAETMHLFPRSPGEEALGRRQGWLD